MRLTISQNILHFGIKCSKLCRFLGPHHRPRWGAYDAPPDPLVVGGYLRGLGGVVGIDAAIGARGCGSRPVYYLTVARTLDKSLTSHCL